MNLDQKKIIKTMKICGDFESFEQNKIDKLLNHNI
jgi:hypothetical protein